MDRHNHKKKSYRPRGFGLPGLGGCGESRSSSRHRTTGYPRFSGWARATTPRLEEVREIARSLSAARDFLFKMMGGILDKGKKILFVSLRRDIPEAQRCLRFLFDWLERSVWEGAEKTFKVAE